MFDEALGMSSAKWYTCTCIIAVVSLTGSVAGITAVGSGLLWIAAPELDGGDFAVPVSTRWDGGVLVNQFPLAISPFEAISFAHHEAFRIARL